MSPVIGRKEYPVRLVVCCDDYTTTIRNVVFMQMLLIDAQHVRRRGRICLHVIVKLETVRVAKITRLADSQITDFRNPLKRPTICWGDTSETFQGPTARLIGSSSVSLPIPCPPPNTSA